MRAWIATVAAVGVLAGPAACSAKQGPADEATACRSALSDADVYPGNIEAQLVPAFGDYTMATSSARLQGIANAQSLINEWQTKLQQLLGKDIKPELRQKLTDATKMLRDVTDTLADATAAVPDPRGRFAVYKDELQRVCK